MKIAVIDGQGGGIGKYLISRMRETLPPSVEIIALGANALATAAMLKAGANDGASGENAICYMAEKVDVIIGTLAILAANSFMGEYTAAMATAVSQSPAIKLLLPLNRINIHIIGASEEPLPHQATQLIGKLKALLEADQHV